MNFASEVEVVEVTKPAKVRDLTVATPITGSRKYWTVGHAAA
jgi:hypothetical protein